MTCKVNGCETDVMYIGKQLCQKHYFRLMRNGTTDRKIVAAYRTSNPAGYQLLNEPTHKLANKNGKVYEHRYLIYKKYGENLPNCELCGSEINWSNCHIDHIDENVKNNNENNLRPLCRPCNTFRNYPEQHMIRGKNSITFEGITMTPHEWARDRRVVITSATIQRRKDAGMSDYDALFAPKITHRALPAKKTITKMCIKKLKELKVKQ